MTNVNPAQADSTPLLEGEIEPGIRVIDGAKYRLHSCLDGTSFWMPETSWQSDGLRDFMTAEDGAKYCQGCVA